MARGRQPGQKLKPKTLPMAPTTIAMLRVAMANQGDTVKRLQRAIDDVNSSPDQRRALKAMQDGAIEIAQGIGAVIEQDRKIADVDGVLAGVRSSLGAHFESSGGSVDGGDVK